MILFCLIVDMRANVVGILIRGALLGYLLEEVFCLATVDF